MVVMLHFSIQLEIYAEEQKWKLNSRASFIADHLVTSAYYVVCKTLYPLTASLSSQLIAAANEAMTRERLVTSAKSYDGLAELVFEYISDKYDCSTQPLCL